MYICKRNRDVAIGSPLPAFVFTAESSDSLIFDDMKKIICAVSAFLCATVMMGQSPINFGDLSPIPMDPAVRYGKLDNGLTYYIRHNDVVPERADFYIAQNVGAILEEDNQNGLAHFLEHMAFNGTKNFPDKGIIDYLETIGVQFGNNVNAYTSLDETVYNLKSVPTMRESIVDTALLVLHDWSGFISLKSEEIDKERGVIREEWRSRQNAKRRLWKASLPILYKNSQYAKRDIIGDTAIIANFAYDTLRAYYHRWYRPDLQSIVIVGDVNVDSVENTIKRMWTDIPKRVNPDKRVVYQLERVTEPIVAILTDKEAKTSSVRIDYRMDKLSDQVVGSKAGYKISIVRDLIESMMSDRLDEISQKADAPFAGASVGYGEIVRSKDAFILLAVPVEGQEEQSFAALLAEGERMKRFGFTQAELDRAKESLLSAMEKSYNERGKTKNGSYVQEYIRNFLDKEPVPGIEWEYEAVREMLPTITLDLVNRHAKTAVSSKEITVLMTGPEKESVRFPNKERVLAMLQTSASMQLESYTENDLQAPLVGKMPKQGKVKKERKVNELENVTEWILSNGMRVVIRPTQLKEDEIILYGYSEGGLSMIDNVSDMPSANLCVSVAQNNGKGNFNAIDLGKKLAGKVVRLNPSVGAYNESFSGSSSVKDFETLAQLVYLLFTGTRTDDESYQALINQYHTVLVNADKDPNRTFSDSVQVTVNGHHERTTPFGLKQLEQVNQKTSLEIFTRRFMDPKDFTVFIVGNVDLAKIKEPITRYLGGIPVQKKMKEEQWIDRQIRRPNGVVNNTFSRELEIKKTSSFVVYGAEMRYTLRNRLIMQLIGDILDIRYFESMRENEGGTYGVSVRGSLSKKPVEYASLQMRYDTDPEMFEKLQKIVYSEVDSFITDGPKVVDFNKAVLNLKNKFTENQKENNWQLSAMVAYYNDHEDLAKDYLSTLESITRDELRDTLKWLREQNNRIEVVMKPQE